MEPNTDWRDGFLFVGNQLSLDFLNTRPVIDGNPVELLPDPASLLRWLTAAGVVTKHEASQAKWPIKPDKGFQKLLELREEWRHVVLDIEDGKQPSPAFLRHLNTLLEEHPFVDEVTRSSMSLQRKRRFTPRKAKDALAPVLDEIANLLTQADWTRIRKCPNCVLHFYDVSKSGARRWCSMNMCGNRNKVAAYAQRHRGNG
jgi:predicted RNA-binding Zn ribbon-like protein